MDIENRLYISNCRICNWTGGHLEVPLYGRYIWRRRILFYLYYFHHFYRHAYFTSRIYHWSWFAKRCLKSLYDFCTSFKVALYRDSWNDYMFHTFILLQCCRRLDLDLSVSNNHWSSIWTPRK